MYITDKARKRLIAKQQSYRKNNETQDYRLKTVFSYKTKEAKEVKSEILTKYSGG